MKAPRLVSTTAFFTNLEDMARSREAFTTASVSAIGEVIGIEPSTMVVA